jgi:hypothetical protein
MKLVPVLPGLATHRSAHGPERAHQMLGRIRSNAIIDASEFFQVLFHQRVQGRMLLFGHAPGVVGRVWINF